MRWLSLDKNDGKVRENIKAWANYMQNVENLKKYSWLWLSDEGVAKWRRRSESVSGTRIDCLFLCQLFLPPSTRLAGKFFQYLPKNISNIASNISFIFSSTLIDWLAHWQVVSPPSDGLAGGRWEVLPIFANYPISLQPPTSQSPQAPKKFPSKAVDCLKTFWKTPFHHLKIDFWNHMLKPKKLVG